MIDNLLPPNDDGSMTRDQMPQIKQRDLPELLAFMGKRGVKFSAGYTDPKTVFAKQAVNREVCENLPDHVLERPTIIAGDRRIIDGDHRWYGHVLKESLMPYIMFEGLTFEEAIKTVFEFPKTYRTDEEVAS